MSKSVLFFLAMALFGCAEKPKEAPKETGRGVLITAARAEMRHVERAVAFVGELQAEDEATIKAEVKGKVEAVHKKLGDGVKKGETIARLNSEEYGIARDQAAHAVKEAQSRYELARLNWERARELFEKGLISDRERDEASESLKGLEAQVKERHSAFEIANKKVRDTDIIAPFAGEIKERFVNPGDHVDDKAPIVSLVSVTPLKLRAPVPERVAGLLNRGQKVSIRVEAFPGKSFEGTVARISPSVDTKTRTLLIEALFPNTDRILKPGFFAEGRIVLKKGEKAVLVPEEAIVTFAGIRKVFTMEDGKAAEREVEVGERVENMVEIVSGVKEGDVVATSAQNKLSTGTAVEIKR